MFVPLAGSKGKKLSGSAAAATTMESFAAEDAAAVLPPPTTGGQQTKHTQDGNENYISFHDLLLEYKNQAFLINHHRQS
jgi:hypothetical protein